MQSTRQFNLLPPTLLLALSALFSRLLGVLRDHLLAKTFGATAGTGLYDLDVYYAAFRIPDLIYNLLVLGVISAAFIPIFTEYKQKGDLKNAWEFANSLLHLMFLAVLILAGLLYLIAPWAVHWVAGGFSPEQLALTAKLLRIMLISPILFAVSSVFISIQDSFRAFFFRSLAPLFYNAGIIFGVLYFAPSSGVIGVTWGVVLGACLQLVVQLPALRLVGYRYFCLLGYQRKDVRLTFKLIAPRVLGLSLTQLTLILNTLIASFLSAGSITVFYLADNLQAIPLGIIGLSYAITSFAVLSGLANHADKKPFALEMRRVLGQVLFLVIPATVGLISLRHEMIRTLLVYGKFTTADAELTAKILTLLVLSLFAQSLIPTLARGFYAYRNTKIPLLTGLAGSVISVGGSLFLGLWFGWGISGIALAFSSGAIVNFLLLYAGMVRLTGFDVLKWMDALKMVLMSLIMGSLVTIAKAIVPFQGSGVTLIGLLIFYTVIGLIVYFSLAVLAGLPQMAGILRHFKKAGIRNKLNPDS